MPKAIERRAHAKINLALHVVGRRADGYHLLDSIAVFADCADVIVVEPAEELSLAVTGPFASHAPADRSDLAWRAAEALCAHIGCAPTVRILVEKNIPAGAGLGGGSADAAAVLLALNEFFAAGIPTAELARIGLALGADVPMCLSRCALRARGVGEDIAPIEGWPPLPLVLAWPGRAVPTAEAFAALAERDNAPLPGPPAMPPAAPSPSAMSVADVAVWLARCRNDLEAPALTIAPEIGDVLAALRGTEGCLLARMSGSGSACFGLYPDRTAAAAAAGVVSQDRSSWWTMVSEAT